VYTLGSSIVELFGKIGNDKMQSQKVFLKPGEQVIGIKSRVSYLQPAVHFDL
jgi:hypothetical protein